jgi:hypothetical protein
MSGPQEKRSAPREPAHLVATIELGGKEIGCGVSRDASGSGFLLLTHIEIALGTEVALRVFVPGEAEPRKIQASVVRSERIPPQEHIVWDYRLALALRDPTPDLQELVRSLAKR